MGLGAVGVLLGYSLSRMGFADWREVHRMFTFADLRLLFTFMAGVVLTGLVIRGLQRGAPLAPKPLHKGTAIGGALFGLGWAVTGACPGAALVQLGEGQVASLVTLAGIFAGTAAYKRVHQKYFRWDRGACEE